MSEIPVDFPRPNNPASGRDVRYQCNALARRMLVASAATAFIAAWQSPRDSGTAQLPAGPRWRAALSALLSTVQRRIESTNCAATPIHLDSSQLVPLFTGLVDRDERFDAIAIQRKALLTSVIVIVVVQRGRALNQLDALARLAADRLTDILEAGDRTRRHVFWRRRALAVSDRLARARSERARADIGQRRLDAAVAAVSRLRPRTRFDGLGSIAARYGPFDPWFVAIAGDDGLRMAAASTALTSLFSLDGASAIADSFRRKSTILRVRDRMRSAVYHEDDLFARFAAYLCVPFERGVFALATNHPIEPATVAAVEAFALRIDPLVRAWLAEAETERLRRLVHSLGLRIFGAIDTERARIARDLHDHQAQLLAAARIALEAGPDQARDVFKQLEGELRLRVRELRPATLGRSTLEEALRRELRRLAGATITGRLIGARRMGALSRPVQQLCYQITREALSNVLRHSEATHVEIGVEKRSGQAVLTIRDNGKGIEGEAIGRSGMGLGGLGERLELMGGKLRIDSRPGSTSIIAEIPEPA